MPGVRCRMDSRPPAHWLVAFSLRFCGSATAYESQTLAAFGEKEHRAAIAVEALSLISCRAPRRKASAHKGSTADSTPKASTHKGSTAESPPKGSTQKCSAADSSPKGSTHKGSTHKGSTHKGSTADSPPKGSTHKRSTADSSFYSTGC